ncbi:ABC transporter permease [Echinicola pacifica]|uniref:ABC transporter permease n=2 Tax=Echinicola pacifica TaxID=346377 RepID=A0A918UW86_9BACT|nr:ABC transporter permease [Echinicola pacifica]
MVDSLEKNIKSSFSFLGTNVLRVDRFPFSNGPGEYPWWKYFRRPPGTYGEFVYLKERLKNAEAITISASANTTLKRGSSSFEGADLQGVVFDHQEVYDVPVMDGRYFTELEISASRNVTILGAKIAAALFPQGTAIGKELKIKGQKFVVIGLLEEEGEGLFDLPSKDNACLIPFGAFGKMFYMGRWGIEPTIAAKGSDSDKGLVALENEMTGLLRGKRGLKPIEVDSFALNKSEFIQNAIGAVFDVISIAGAVIGGFSILVGGFGIANIMFVSVRERTNIIGIQKSLGAKNYFILLQFLFESTFLSIIGGLTGLMMVFAFTFVPFGSLEIFMSANNIILGLGLSTVIGMLSGAIPAAMAARMDPVEAIRTN